MISQKQKESHKRSYEKHREERLAGARAWKAANKEKVKEARAEYFAKNKSKEYELNKIWLAKNPGKKSAYDRKYREKNLEKIKEHRSSFTYKDNKNKKAKARYHSDENYKIEKILRASVLQALRLHKEGRKANVIKSLIGCSIEALVTRLKSQFKPGMSWANHGQWHIDHKKPCKSFNLLDPKQQLQCFHYSNLQPLWAIENIKKGNRV